MKEVSGGQEESLDGYKVNHDKSISSIPFTDTKEEGNKDYYIDNLKLKNIENNHVDEKN